MSDEGGITLVHASLSRMGTMSMSEAYKILGLKPHHYHVVSSGDSDWAAFDRAVDGKWPEAPGAKPGRRPFTRADWDAVRGGYDFFTDFFAHLSPDIIRAYPEAKVVVVERDFDSWWPSYMDRCIDSISSPVIRPLNFLLRLFQGTTAIDAVTKQYYGFFGVNSLSAINRKNGRMAYTEFFDEVRSLVPPERRLEYSLRDGWEPLCKFLDKPVPSVPFPRLNTLEEFQKRGRIMIMQVYGVLATVVVGVVAVVWYFVR